ncbi:DUF536 domain-containing protein [Periweissella fabalis]|uniref:DUF536 domain-containing protein n=1 Tax=Periweissella fabalis TaxID=1070421 RepID=A0A7X6N3I1_9LACO|nr:DUF536 domain-containing protein [Periweissella fabalis]MCM0598362.1 DUF536 domain-containing protein [Periweissella fabalis]NKZ25033.1 DUF536 domain-containing protein [Periweissella fabalis]
MSENLKTIRELADELGVSKTAIHKKISETIKRQHFSKNGNRFLIDEEGQNIIKSMFIDLKDENQKPEVSVPVSDIKNKDNQKVSEVSELVSVLKDRILVSDEQNKSKDQQIERLQKLLDQQQILTLQANKKIEQLETELEKEDKNETSKETSDKTKTVNEKKSFWKKLFSQ